MPKDFLQQFVSLRDSLTKERSELQARLAAIRKAMGGEIPVPFVKAAGGEIPVPFGTEPGAGKKRRTMSAGARAKIAAAQRRRWAASRDQETGGKAAQSPAAPKPIKRKMSSAARARIAAAARARWAKARAAGRNAL